MSAPVKIATCCYCGTRASLVLDKRRHELACATCGAPLHHLKQMPQQKRKTAKPARATRNGPKIPARPERPPRKSRRKRLGRKIFEELWDLAEDIFD